MNWLANLPVQRKLGYAMLLTSTVASLLACAVFLTVEYIDDQGNLEHTVATLARITADNSTAAIAFADRTGARQNLEALRAEPQITAATLFDDEGRVFAQYEAHPGDSRPAAANTPVGVHFADGRILAVQPVMEGSRRLGTLYLQASLTQIYARMRTYALVVLGVMASSFGLAGLIASVLRRTLARPILELANTAEAVSTQQDYSIRARQYGQDELGQLTMTFNAMLERTEAAVKEQIRTGAVSRQLAAIVESSDDAIIGKDLDGIITAWNRGAERLYGYTSAEMIGQPVTLLIPPGRKDEEPRILDRIRRDEHIEHYETIRRHKNGTLMDVSLTVSPIKDAAGRVVGASKIARDITERKRHAELLRESMEQLRLVTDNAPIFLVRTDPQHRFTFVNRAYAERNGSRPDDIVGRTVAEVVGPAAYATFKPRMDEALAGARVEFEMEIPYDRIGHRWVHVIYVPERNLQGQVTGLLGVISDIGARKQAEHELKRARDEALAASRAKDDFLAALSHELRTPLNPVLLLASDAAANPDLPAAIRADFDLIRKNVNLEARLIDDLLDLTRITRGKLTLEHDLCNLHAVLRDAIANVGPDLKGKSLRLTTDLAAKKHIVVGDSVRLQQVFWNVLKNAVKFTPEHGSIVVKTALAPAGDRIVVNITDSGIGMTGDELKRAFEAFSQGDHAGDDSNTHRFGGLGLGLAISKMLVDRHAGQIQAFSAGRDQGSSFVVELPLSVSAGTPRNSFPPELATVPPFVMVPAAGPATPRRILLVEDHAATRLTLQALLRNRQHHVAVAESAARASELGRAGEFDLVISDVGLPDRSGYELMAELRSIHPFLPGIALSGYGMEEDLQRSKAAGFAVHLVKPVTISMLEEAIASLPPPATPRPASNPSHP